MEKMDQIESFMRNFIVQVYVTELYDQLIFSSLRPSIKPKSIAKPSMKFNMFRKGRKITTDLCAIFIILPEIFIYLFSLYGPYFYSYYCYFFLSCYYNWSYVSHQYLLFFAIFLNNKIFVFTTMLLFTKIVLIVSLFFMTNLKKTNNLI